MPAIQSSSSHGNRSDSDALEEIVAGDIRLRGVFPYRNDYTLDISDTFFSHLSLNEGRVLAHLLRNRDKATPLAEICEISGWSPGIRGMTRLREMIDYSTHFEIAEIHTDNPAYVLQKKSPSDAIEENRSVETSRPKRRYKSREPQHKMYPRGSQQSPQEQYAKPRKPIITPHQARTQDTPTAPRYTRRPLDRTSAPQENAKIYERRAVDIARLTDSAVQVLIDIQEVMEITDFSRDQLKNILEREEAKRFLKTQAGYTRFYLAPFILFLHGGAEHKIAAERLYGEYVKRIKI